MEGKKKDEKKEDQAGGGRGPRYVFVALDVQKKGRGKKYPIFQLGVTVGTSITEALETVSFNFDHPEVQWEKNYKEACWHTAEDLAELKKVEASAKAPKQELQRFISYLTSIEAKYQTSITFVCHRPEQEISDIDYDLYTILDRQLGVLYVTDDNDFATAKRVRNVISLTERLYGLPLFERMVRVKKLSDAYATSKKLNACRADDRSQHLLFWFFLAQKILSVRQQADYDVDFLASSIAKTLSPAPTPAASPQSTDDEPGKKLDA